MLVVKFAKFVLLFAYLVCVQGALRLLGLGARLIIIVIIIIIIIIIMIIMYSTVLISINRTTNNKANVSLIVILKNSNNT